MGCYIRLHGEFVDLNKFTAFTLNIFLHGFEDEDLMMWSLLSLCEHVGYIFFKWLIFLTGPPGALSVRPMLCTPVADFPLSPSCLLFASPAVSYCP